MSAELENRAYIFAKDVRIFCRKLKRKIINGEDIRQLIRSSGSVAANYIEANENLGKADLKMKIRISRKEAKESILWLSLLEVYDSEELANEKRKLIDEAQQLRKILSAILKKLE